MEMASRFAWVARGFALLFAAGMVTGCPVGGELDNADCHAGGCGTDGGGEVTFCDPTPIFMADCNLSICHGGTPSSPPPTGLDLASISDPMELGRSLLDRAPAYATGCAPTNPEWLIDSQNPADSLMLTKLRGAGFECGSAMGPVSADELRCVEQWVQFVVADSAAQ